MGPQVNSKDASTDRVTSAKDRMDELHTELWELLSCPEVYPTEVTGPHYSFFPFLASGELILMLLEEWTCPQSSEFSWATESGMLELVAHKCFSEVYLPAL